MRVVLSKKPTAARKTRIAKKQTRLPQRGSLVHIGLFERFSQLLSKSTVNNSPSTNNFCICKVLKQKSRVATVEPCEIFVLSFFVSLKIHLLLLPRRIESACGELLEVIFLLGFYRG